MPAKPWTPVRFRPLPPIFTEEQQNRGLGDPSGICRMTGVVGLAAERCVSCLILRSGGCLQTVRNERSRRCLRAKAGRCGWSPAAVEAVSQP